MANITHEQPKALKDMPPHELVRRAKELASLIDIGTISDLELTEYNDIKTIYKTKTGMLLTQKVLRYS